VLQVREVQEEEGDVPVTINHANGVTAKVGRRVSCGHAATEQ
jgi:hypothetical protein